MAAHSAFALAIAASVAAVASSAVLTAAAALATAAASSVTLAAASSATLSSVKPSVMSGRRWCAVALVIQFLLTAAMFWKLHGYTAIGALSAHSLSFSVPLTSERSD